MSSARYSSFKHKEKRHHSHYHYNNYAHKYAKSTAGEVPSYEDLMSLNGINQQIREKAHSVADGYDPSQASVRASPEYEILELVNQFRERSLFPRLKFKTSLKDFAIDKALGNDPNIEQEDSFIVVSTMHFVEPYSGESSQELLNRWAYDTNKLQVLLATGNIATVAFFTSEEKKTYIVLLVVSTFS